MAYELKENINTGILRERQYLDFYGTFDSVLKENEHSLIVFFQDENLGKFTMSIRPKFHGLEFNPLPKGKFHLKAYLKSITKISADGREFVYNALSAQTVERIQ